MNSKNEQRFTAAAIVTRLNMTHNLYSPINPGTLLTSTDATNSTTPSVWADNQLMPLMTRLINFSAFQEQSVEIRPNMPL